LAGKSYTAQASYYINIADNQDFKKSIPGLTISKVNPNQDKARCWIARSTLDQIILI
jgi:hypothetical protein